MARLVLGLAQGLALYLLYSAFDQKVWPATVPMLFALTTPIADPMRLSVNDQVARLNAGLVKPDNFDVWYLRSAGGRFGREALITLGASKDKILSPRAENALREQFTDFVFAPQTGRAKPKNVPGNITVCPAGKSLPSSFVERNWDKSSVSLLVPICFGGQTARDWHCEALLKDIDGDGRDEVVLIYTFTRDADAWGNVGVARHGNFALREFPAAVRERTGEGNPTATV